MKTPTTMKFLLLTAVMSLFSNCSKDKVWKDDTLSIKRTDYTGNQLRINGYYYERYSVKNGYRYNIYFFYQNGIVLYGESPLETEVVQMETNYATGGFHATAKDHKYYWGAYIINGTTIQFDRWYPSEPPLKAYVREGTILNDSTFTISTSYRMKDGNKTEVEARNETFHFKAFSPKPDSTNSFVQ